MGKKKKDTNKNSNLIAQNKKARHDYDILDTIEGGLVLTGSEVKSLRLGNANIGECYAQFTVRDEMVLINSHIAQYANAGYAQHDERRDRKVLLHRVELNKIRLKKEQQGLTLVPLRLYWKNGRVKVEIAIAKGRKKHDKREASKQSDWKRQQQRLLKA